MDTPTASTVQSSPDVGVTGPVPLAAMSTPASVASTVEAISAAAVTSAAAMPRRRAGSATGRNRPTSRRTARIAPNAPRRTVTAAKPANR